MRKKIGKFLCRIRLHKKIIEIQEDPNFPPGQIAIEKCSRCGKVFASWSVPPCHPNCTCQQE